MLKNTYEVWSILYKAGGGCDLIFPSVFVSRLTQLGREILHFDGDEISAIKNIRFIMYLNIDPQNDNLSKQYHDYLISKGIDSNNVKCFESKNECVLIESKEELKRYLCSLIEKQ